MRAITRWLGRNISTLLLAFILALIVWVSAVTSADPNQEQTFQVPLEVIGLASDLTVVSDVPERASLTLFAPRSILEEIASEGGAIQAWVDLSELEASTYTVPLQHQVDPRFRPVRVVEIVPETIELTLETLSSKSLPIQIDVRGEPPLGYQAGTTEWNPNEVEVSGRTSLVAQVTAVSATLNISGSEETIDRSVKLTAQDDEGHNINDVTLTPSEVTVVQPITLKGGYRNLVVKVVTTGQIAEGYRQTSISVSPPNVMVFSADPNLVDQLPGYVETEPLDISGAVDDIETILGLNLPEEASVIGDPNVRVQVGIAAMEGNLTVIREIEPIGFLPEYQARVAPGSVEVILYGSIPVLDALTETDVRVVVDLEGLEKGIHQLTPEVIILPERIKAEAVSPGTVEVEILDAEEVTPTPN
jgi:YbbR domain-containing protein